jgi:hypothetical protein
MEKILLVLSHIHPGMYHDKTDECPICKGNYLGQSEYETKKQRNRTHLFTSVTPLENELKSTRNAKTKSVVTFSTVSPSIQIQIQLLAASLHLERLFSSSPVLNVQRSGGPDRDILLLTLSSTVFQVNRAAAEGGQAKQEDEVETALQLVSRSKRSIVFVEGFPETMVIEQRTGFLRLKEKIMQMPGVAACGLLFRDTFSLLKCLNFIKKHEGRCTFVQLLSATTPVSHFAHVGEKASGHLGVPLFM